MRRLGLRQSVVALAWLVSALAWAAMLVTGARGGPLLYVACAGVAVAVGGARVGRPR